MSKPPKQLRRTMENIKKHISSSDIVSTIAIDTLWTWARLKKAIEGLETTSQMSTRNLKDPERVTLTTRLHIYLYRAVQYLA